MKKIAIYGKGGIGKSTVSTHLSIAASLKGKKSLQIGCDPKHDSCKRLFGKNINTVIDEISKKGSIIKKDILHTGNHNIDCIEIGGPTAGMGCAGRGISLVFELFEELKIIEKNKYDFVLFDILGDVVCGGFAAPLKTGFTQDVYIVVSEEIMSLYAANNIAKAVKNYSKNGVLLGGIIVNKRNNNSKIEHIEKFAEKIGSSIIGIFNRSEFILESEKNNKTIFDIESDNKDLIEYKKNIIGVFEKIYNNNEGVIPNTLNEEDFDKFIYEIFGND